MEDDTAGLEAWRAMLLAYNAALRAIDAQLSGASRIPLTWYDVLLELNAGEGGRLRMHEVAGRVVLSRTRVSRLVDEMARAGLVRKEPDDFDRRVVWAQITDQGRNELRTTAPIYLGGIQAHFSAFLTEEEKRVIAEALMKVERGHKERVPVPTPATKPPKWSSLVSPSP